jgi:dTDP-4-dehydrorhamnose reductase
MGNLMAAAKRLFCFGCGYSARVFAARFRAKGGSVAGTCRTADKAAGLAASGIVPFLFGDGLPLEDPASALAGTTHLLISAPPGEKGDPVLAAHAADLRRIAPHVEWAGYLSTTGVYGDRQGGWVDEETPLDPAVARSDRRVKAEAAWTEFAASSGLPLHIFRLAGIYGPGRNQLLSVLDGSARRIVKEGQIFSRIHVEDIANVLEASMARPNPGAIYNVCDDEPAAAGDVVAYAAELLGRTPPPEIPFEKAELSPMGRSFYMSSRRVSNRRIHEELGLTLAYPTYREGLKSLLGTL